MTDRVFMYLVVGALCSIKAELETDVMWVTTFNALSILAFIKGLLVFFNDDTE